VVLPGVPIPAAAAPAVSALSASLAARLSDDERDALAVAVNRLDARGGRVDLNAWTRCVELTASRAGLLLSGDLRTAMTRLRTETREVAEVTFDEKRKDLLACCSSSALAELRTRVALVASPIPPRTSGTMPRADFQQTTDWGVLAVDELGPAGRLVGGRGRT